MSDETKAAEASDTEISDTGTPAAEASSEAPQRSGIVALVGRPNAGKSTLMNRLLEEKVAIVSDKPQTTRHRLVGILSGERGQMVFYDTPGMHKPLSRMNRQMVTYALDALNEADVICVLVDAATSAGSGDAYLDDLVARAEGAKVLALNKVDVINKGRLLPRIETYAEQGVYEEIVPVSALTGDGCDVLLDILWRLLPPGEPRYDADLLTVHALRFLVTERIREKVLMHTREELPYATAVVLDGWEEEESGGERPGLVRIYASILAEKPGQKKILIGRRGSMIKQIGTDARLDLEDYLGRKVYLDLRVKLEPNWRENRRVLGEIDQDVVGSL